MGAQQHGGLGCAWRHWFAAAVPFTTISHAERLPFATYAPDLIYTAFMVALSVAFEKPGNENFGNWLTVANLIGRYVGRAGTSSNNGSGPCCPPLLLV